MPRMPPLGTAGGMLVSSVGALQAASVRLQQGRSKRVLQPTFAGPEGRDGSAHCVQQATEDALDGAGSAISQAGSGAEVGAHGAEAQSCCRPRATGVKSRRHAGAQEAVCRAGAGAGFEAECGAPCEPCALAKHAAPGPPAAAVLHLHAVAASRRWARLVVLRPGMHAADSCTRTALSA